MSTGQTNRYKRTSFEIGEIFEDYVRKNIFTKDHYSIIERTPNHQQNKGDFIESSKNPDFKLRDKTNNKEFQVEAKFRSENHEQDSVIWCDSHQLERYREFNKQLAVIIVIGLGGLPENPNFLFFFSLSVDIKSEVLKTELEKFKITPGKPVLPDVLWEYLDVFNL